MTTQDSQTYVHPRSESIQSRFIKLFLMLTRTKSALGRTLAQEQIQNDPEPMPNSFQQKYQVTEEPFGGRSFWTISPKNSQSSQVIFYVHGGGYVFNMVAFQWNFIAKLVDTTHATVVVPNYPLVPQSNADAAYTYMEQLYKKVLDTYQGKDIIFMGDSAGAGLAIAFAQFVRDNNLTSPTQLIVLSPWLDVTMSNPDIPSVDPNDRMLEANSLRQAGEMWADTLSTKDPRVSPIYGSFANIPKLSIFMGTHDLFYPDVLKLKVKLEQEGISFNYYEYPRMMHTWAIAPMPEAQAAFDQILHLLKK